MSITQKDFYSLPAIQEQLNIQKTNPYGSAEHRGAHEKIISIAIDFEIDKNHPQYFLTMKTY